MKLYYILCRIDNTILYAYLQNDITQLNGHYVSLFEHISSETYENIKKLLYLKHKEWKMSFHICRLNSKTSSISGVYDIDTVKIKKHGVEVYQCRLEKSDFDFDLHTKSKRRNKKLNQILRNNEG